MKSRRTAGEHVFQLHNCYFDNLIIFQQLSAKQVKTNEGQKLAKAKRAEIIAKQTFVPFDCPLCGCLWFTPPFHHCKVRFRRRKNSPLLFAMCRLILYYINKVLAQKYFLYLVTCFLKGHFWLLMIYRPFHHRQTVCINRHWQALRKIYCLLMTCYHCRYWHQN